MIRRHAPLIVVAALILACGGDEPQVESPATSSAALAEPPRTVQQEMLVEPVTLAPEEVPVPTTPTVRASGTLYTVQVASFQDAAMARAWRERLEKAGYPVWSMQAVVDGKIYHRLRVGAHPRLSETRSLGERIRRELKWPVWIAPVESGATIPAEVLDQTAQMVGGA